MQLDFAAGRKIQVLNLKFAIDQYLKFSLRLTKLQRSYSSMNAFKLVFWYKLVLRKHKNPKAIVFLINLYY